MKYLNALRNQWIVARSWMFSSLLLAGMLFYMMTSYVQLAGNMPTRLVPYDLHVLEGPVEVGARASHTDGEYLSQIAIADVQLHSSWTPANVASQYGRFQNRMTPALYARAGTDLQARVPDLEDSERSQALFVERSEARDDTVRVYGRLRVWHGSDLVEDDPIVYRVRYSFSNGIPYLAAFSVEEQ
ncbi:MAG: hypothetical protein CL484_14115 [Acidobacteria bacterium]|jgi:hypothetical protein|nr:hypothetical protein [Acidobacteriota bacterium]|tara:strand:+ start:2409 stop:2966 length:558 start_codon:yes stop_codon:yes gene_type:complete